MTQGAQYDEEAVRFSSHGQCLHGIRHLPLKPTGPVPAVVILHGFTGNHIASYRKFVTLGRRLAMRGVATLRFDFRGCGNSEGLFEDTTITGMVDDAAEALKVLRSHPAIDATRIGLVGVSFGGLIAVQQMSAEPALQVAALWSPVGLPDMQLAIRHDEELDRQFREDGKAEIDGWMVGREFVAEFEQQDPMRVAASMAQRRVLIIHGDADHAVPVQTAEAYRKHFVEAGNEFELCVLQGADHSFGRVAWQEEALNRTVDWMVKRL